jgi:two-component system, chemotaxis family, protein-glutamate methylesterase/glutaminase
MPGKDIIVVGTSSGGIEALQQIARGLPRDFGGSLFVVLHTSPESPGFLPQILESAGPVPATNAADGERIRPGRIYVAPPDYHLLVEPGRVRVAKGPKENRFRPAIDPLFRSAAQTYGPRVVGVVLTGNLDDGAAGLWAVKRLGGTSVVQDPEDALFPSMPRNAMRLAKVDHCVPLAGVAPLLVELAGARVAEEGARDVPEEMEIEVKIAMEDNALGAGITRLGEPSIYACPDCHGVLLQVKEGGHVRFRCHTGHAYSPDSLLAEITETVEDSLWSSIRAIEETIMLLRQMAEHVKESHADGAEAELLTARAQEAQRRADLVRQAVMSHEELSEGKIREAARAS